MVERSDKVIKLFIFVFNFLFFVSFIKFSDYCNVKINNISYFVACTEPDVISPKRNFKGNLPLTDFVIMLFFS